MATFGIQAFSLLALYTLMTSHMTMATGDCSDPDYLQQLKSEVRQFYEFHHEMQSGLSYHGPCSFVDDNMIARPRWSVSTLEDWHPERSTCPWVADFDEDFTGGRYPCRMFTARSLLHSHRGRGVFNGHGHQPCLRTPLSRHRRYEGKLCEPLLQSVPVVVKTGCFYGVNTYEIRNRTITVGFTCAFEMN